ncbi:MAG: ATP-binding cassette domain-containing protein [Paeniclostridium sordellii]|uniref:Bacitracin transport ATP-binding protein BcrA n=1 Tax=Clostridium perfringens D str. JGS1721 TaxID=488537 RepID=B1V0D6_CLOPF|nr:ATP-binding cassette domain-containing protein [Clostridium perfringens]EDT72698.1 bacitracin transport ATP-binding protein BcrA [Clostridium perfringens D str. JGS1721]MDU2688362.1 ATP-binding cassette domain-containing protein [Paeniclostridium sordellii]
MDILLQDVSKKYGSKKVVDNININIPSGKIYGFLGLNGAGKTTTMRMMTGLTPISNGKIIFNGKPYLEMIDKYDTFGAFISTPSYYKNLTAYENLAMIQRIIKKPLNEVDRVLKLVGLNDSKYKKVSEFSFGMKQRLGLAFAFLNDPDVLILDEPTNGLDPKGIVEIRNLLYSLSKIEGKTIFISSHNIAELEQIADIIGIIHKGKIIFQGSLETLYNKAGLTYNIEVDNKEKMIAFLNEEKILFESNYNTFEIVILKKEIPSIIDKIRDRGISIYEIVPNKSLEKIFLKLTGGGEM